MYNDEIEKFLLNLDADMLNREFHIVWKKLLSIIPEFELCTNLPQDNPHHIYNVDEHILRSVAYIDNKDIFLRKVMLFHDLGKGVTKSIDEKGVGHFYKHPFESKRLSEEILVRFGVSNEEIREISFFIERHDSTLTKKSIRKLYNNIGYIGVERLLRIKEADSKAQNPIYISEKLEIISKLREYLKEYEAIVD